LKVLAVVINDSTGPSQRCEPQHDEHARCAAPQGFFDGALCFFIPFVAASPTGADSLVDVYTIGRAAYIALLGVVTVEIMLVTRFWTKVFIVACVLSYAAVYGFMFLLAYVYKAVGNYNSGNKHIGIPQQLVSAPWFWIAIITVSLTALTFRLAELTTKRQFRPDPLQIVSELEVRDARAMKRGAAAANGVGGGGGGGGAADVEIADLRTSAVDDSHAPSLVRPLAACMPSGPLGLKVLVVTGTSHSCLRTCHSRHQVLLGCCIRLLVGASTSSRQTKATRASACAESCVHVDTGAARSYEWHVGRGGRQSLLVVQ
jgi:Phospholipid-translocating P-type ATPase C-terminal